jgi:hypothetical protein
VGNFNNDEYDDLVITAPGEKFDGLNPGAIHILYGSENGLQTADPDEQFWHEGLFEQVHDGSIFFGHAVTASDFNGDGYDDLAVGSPISTVGGLETAGVAHVIYGSALGLQIQSPPVQLWHQDVEGVDNPAEEHDQFGYSVTGGDLNGDGYADLALGAQFEAIGTVVRAGAVNVLYGSSNGLRTDTSNDGTGRTDQFWHQDTPSLKDSAEVFDGFGFTLIIRDFNGDGYGDLAIGIRQESLNAIASAGAVQIIYGGNSGLQKSSPTNQFWNQNTSGVRDTGEGDEFFGTALA